MGILSTGEYLLSWPLKLHTITSGFYRTNSSVLHYAIDMRAAQGTPVYAAEAGRVDLVQYWDGRTKTGNQSYGNMIRVNHCVFQGKTLQTRYAHLKTILVKTGEQVSAGQVIGYTGNTGNSEAAHLHFEVIWGGIRRNPLVWLDSNFGKANADVYTFGHGEHSVETAKTMKRIKTDPMSEGDAKAVTELLDGLEIGYTVE